MMNKKLALVLTVILTMCISFSTYAAGGFKDVPEGYWAEKEIIAFANRGIVTGYTNGNFKPEDGVTREEFCKMLVVAFGNRGITSSEQSFEDVPKGRWSHGYVEEGGKYFTVENKSDGKYFYPDEPATRAEVTAALVKRLGYGLKDIKDKDLALGKFSDGKEIPEELLPYVSFASENGIVNGYTDGSFKPDKGLTRSEAVVLLYRITLKEETVTPQNKIKLEITSCPEETTDYSITISGTVHDENDGYPVVTVNGEKVRVLNGKWTHYRKVSKGENKIEIVATNKYGHTVEITKTVVYGDSTAAEKEPERKGGFAIVTKVSRARDAEGEEVINVSCTKNEEEGVVILTENSRNQGKEHTLSIGDVFMYNTDKNGQITEYLVIAQVTSTDNFEFVGGKSSLEDALSTRKKPTELVLGYIENDRRKTNSKGEIITVNGESYVITSDTFKYTFDTTGRNNRIEISDFMYEADYFEPGEDSEDGGIACPILLRVVNGVVIDAYASNTRVKIN